MEEDNSCPVFIWEKQPDTALERFKKIIENKYNTTFDSYWDLHRWSVENFAKFWEEMWLFIGVVASRPHDEVFVKTGKTFLDNEWFKGAEFNYAENLLRIRDNRVALICLDELGNEERITFAEMFQEVKLYAAAFRRNGLQKGDKVASFLSNRKEAIFAMLATTSIGAIWGGALPYYGARAASNIITMMDPKFLITVDAHQDNGVSYKTFDCLPVIVNNAPTIERVILVVTDDTTYEKNLTVVRNCVFLRDFLQEGQAPGNHVPDIIFEQLPFDYPVCINFTSGTSGLPKAPIHSAGTLITQIRDFVFHFDIQSEDVICTYFPVGWTLWDSFVPSLALGVTLFLYCGSPYHKIGGMNFWDLLDKYDTKFTFIVSSMVDKFEKMELIPSPGSKLNKLKFIMLGGCPVKNENLVFLHDKVKKDAFIGSIYGATELFGKFSGFDMNMPVHGREVQVPALGIDIQCFDEQGRSVVGQRGEVVVCTPAPNFPVGLWKDDNSEIMTKTYLSKYTGVWNQNDECWINPKTKGMIIIGRSDDTLKQNGERFGASDIYFAIHAIEELQDYICVGQNNDRGSSRAVLFIKMQNGYKFTPAIRAKIAKAINDELFGDCVPEVIVEVPDIPYNLNNKRMESVVRKLVHTNKIPDVPNIKNSESLKHFLNIPEIVSYNQMVRNRTGCTPMTDI